MELEIVVVDDDSPDGTGDLVQEYVEHNSTGSRSVKLIRRKGKMGLSSAILTGAKSSSGEIIVVMDADFSHPPEVIPQLIDALRSTDCNLVVASRKIKGGGIVGWPLRRRIISKGAGTLAHILGIGVSDPMSGFFAFERGLIDGVHFDALGYKLLPEIIVKSKGVKIKEIPFIFVDRRVGKSKFGLRVALDYLRTVWQLYRFTH